MKTTAKQCAAIAQLETALAACRKAGVKLFGMDNVLYVTVKHDPSKGLHAQYQESSGGDSDLYETLTAALSVYVESGGW